MPLAALALSGLLLGRQSLNYKAQFIVGSPLEKGIPGSAMGIDERRLRLLEDRVWDSVLSEDLNWKPGTIDEWAKKLRSKAEALFTSDMSNPAKEYIIGYFVASWVASHMIYKDEGDGVSHTGRDPSGNVIAFEKRYNWFNLGKYMQCATMSGACRHTAVLCRELVNRAEVGFKADCRYVGGYPLGLPGADPSKAKPQHAWDMLTLSNGVSLPFDAAAIGTVEDWKVRHKLWTNPLPEFIFPRTPEALEHFLGMRYGTRLDWYDELDSELVCRNTGGKRDTTLTYGCFQAMPLQQWLRADKSGLPDLKKWLRQYYKRR